MGLIGRRLVGVVFASAFVALTAVGCESIGTGDEEDVVPAGSTSPWELAGLCQENITRHAGVRQQELADGVVRWQCGDRPGVDGADRGQEYCEYHAVSNGKIITTYDQIDQTKPLYCFFSSVYLDNDPKRDTTLATELSKAANLNAKIPATMVRMKGQFNSRGAATTLVSDAMAVPTDVNDQRQAACFLYGVNNPTKAASLEKACKGKNLATKTGWTKVTKLGVTIPKEGDATYEAYRDLVSCMSVGRLGNGGVDWRMSDPHITQVVVRANDECGCSYNALPTALEGFLQGTWSSKDALPPGCRRVKVAGADYQQMTICEVPKPEIGDLATSLDYSENLDGFCNERFGTNIVLTAPLRAVENPGSCTTKTGAFCSAFTKTAK